jgi:putative ABC transport system permease protein
MNTWRDDLRYGLRVFAKSPASLLAALASLTIGIGATTAVFSVVDALLLRPLPYPDTGRIGIIWQRSPGLGVAQDWLSTGQYLDVAAEASVFEYATAAIGASFNVTGEGEPDRVDGVRVTSSFFPLFGGRASLGRAFTANDDVPGGENVVLLTHGYWRRRYGSDPSIVGKRIVLNGNPFTIVGVLSARFSFSKEVMPAVNGIQHTDLVLPLRLPPSARATRGGEDYNMFVKLKPGIEFAAAQAELDVVAERMKREYPDMYPAGGGLSIDVIPLRTQVVGDVRLALSVLLGSVVIVLLIACSNVANLLLARAAAREQEIAVRVAMGARRSRLVRQLLTESLALSGAAGITGVGLALLLLRMIRLLGAGNVPLVSEVRIDVPVLAFTLGVSLATPLLFGLVPALRATSVDPQAALRAAGRGADAGHVLGMRHGRLRRALTAGEIALSVLLLIGAGLLIRSYRRVTDANPGFDPRGVLSFRLTLPPARYRTPASVGVFFDQLGERLRVLPGVESVGSNYQLPLSTVALAWEPITIEGYVPHSSADERIITSSAYVSADYFRVMRISLRDGRAFNAHDDLQAPPVVIVDDRLAARFWPNASALGKRLRQGVDGPWRTVVGVVTNASEYELMAQPPITTYFPVAQYPIRSRFIVVRADSGVSPAGLMSAVRREIRALDPDLPAYDVATMDRRVADSLARRRLAMSLLTTFAAFAVILAAIGTYGVIAYWVDRRRREVGIRMALGADPMRILRLLGGELLVIVGSGVAVGLAGALALTRLLAGMLFHTAALDALTFTGAPLLIAAVAAIATYVPARRATRIDAAEALRLE